MQTQLEKNYLKNNNFFNIKLNTITEDTTSTVTMEARQGKITKPITQTAIIVLLTWNTRNHFH